MECLTVRTSTEKTDVHSTHLTGAFSTGDSVRETGSGRMLLLVFKRSHSNTKTSQRETCSRLNNARLLDFGNWFETPLTPKLTRLTDSECIARSRVLTCEKLAN